MNLQLNDLNKYDFITSLQAMTYEEIQAVYETLDYNHKAALLKHCALLIGDYLERRNQLTTIAEIKEYVRMLPIWQERQIALSLQVDQLKLQRPAPVPEDI